MQNCSVLYFEFKTWQTYFIIALNKYIGFAMLMMFDIRKMRSLFTFQAFVIVQGYTTFHSMNVIFLLLSSWAPHVSLNILTEANMKYVACTAVKITLYGQKYSKAGCVQNYLIICTLLMGSQLKMILMQSRKNELRDNPSLLA